MALFIDRALATFFGRLAPDFRSQLAAFRLRCQAQHPDASSFAALTNEQQMQFLTQVERTPFFVQALAFRAAEHIARFARRNEI